MRNDDQSEQSKRGNTQGFLSSLIQGAIRDTISLWVSFLIGTVAGAVMWLYFGLPLIFSLLGGVLVLAVYAAYDKL